MRRFAVLFGLIAFVATGTYAATKIDLQNYKDFKAAYAGITQAVKSGWIPVGVDAFDEGDLGGIWILYTDTTPLATKGGSWDFLFYSDGQKLEADLNLAVSKGWTPMDFAEDSSGTYVLYLKTTLPLKDWDLQDVDNAVDEINANAESELKDGWVPLGIHMDADGQESLLYARFKGTNPVKSVDIARYGDYADLEKDVQANAAKGWTPVGFTADNEGAEITVIFIK